jgi:response regulator RpfG family c-di-GMP phosphodiesterase
MGDLQTGSRILVVDDETALREVIARRLRRAGYAVTTAENSEVALRLTELGRPPFALIITDVHMPPGMSGLDLATALIERRPTQRIIIMTSDPDEALRRAALARGPVNFIPKPFELFELEEAVKQALVTQRNMMTPPPSAQRAYRQAAIGTTPARSLLWVDERSHAGRGHADRVARMARVVAKSLVKPLTSFEQAELEVAAWSHELALLTGAVANPVEMAWRSAQMLEENGSNDLVCQIVRHMHERWDGSGGPERLVGDAIPLGAQILSVVDGIDHYCAALLQIGMRPELAAHRAVSLVVSQQGSCFSPHITDIVNQNRDAIRNICGVVRVNLSLEAIA